MKPTRRRSIELTGGAIAKMLSRRFGAGFHSPMRNGLYWRAARLAAGMNSFDGRFGRDQVIIVPHRGRRSFLGAVGQHFAAICC